MSSTAERSGPSCSDRVVIIDDDALIRKHLERILSADGAGNCFPCAEAERALDVIRETEPELVFLDLRMPGLSGEELLPRIAEEMPELPIIVLTSVDDINTAVHCMQIGAADYLLKPLDQHRILNAVQRLGEIRELKRMHKRLKQELLTPESKGESFPAMITRSKPMERLFSYAAVVAPTKQTVLIAGETGTGKELLARGIHNLSGCRGPFIAVNTAGLDDTLFSDTLFGHARGSFTGAEGPRSGLIEKAAGGTLFLDEIGDLSQTSQVKLLRLLDNRSYYPLGADTPRTSHTRIITATNRDLRERVRAGVFRRDLFFRLSINELILPPLRTRREDIAPLFETFLGQEAENQGVRPPRIPSAFFETLMRYSFPGNVRELKSLAIKTVNQSRSRGALSAALTEHIALTTELSAGGSRPDQGDSLASLLESLHPLPTLKQTGEALVEAALRQSGGVQTRAAALLGITQQALSNRLRKKERHGR